MRPPVGLRFRKCSLQGLDKSIGHLLKMNSPRTQCEPTSSVWFTSWKVKGWWLPIGNIQELRFTCNESYLHGTGPACFRPSLFSEQGSKDCRASCFCAFLSITTGIKAIVIQLTSGHCLPLGDRFFRFPAWSQFLANDAFFVQAGSPILLHKIR